MNTLSYKTQSVKNGEFEKNWILVDAKDQVLGRLASKIAFILRGKHKALYTPHVDCGDNVVVINAELVKLTGKKWNEKIYFRHSGYPGGETLLTANQVLAKDPRRPVEIAVKGMLPKTRLGRTLFTHLHVYAGENHKHQGQNPQPITILGK